METKVHAMQKLYEQVKDCRNCRLHEKRTNFVFGQGNPRSPLMIVGEAPGEQEDLQGLPFVGKAGQLLNNILQAAGIKREEIYITNIVKCRPPGNRTPTEEEMESCKPLLREQFRIIRPKILVLLGSAPTRAILDPQAKITRIRGQWVERKGVKIMPTYHPAYLLRNPERKRECWIDFQKIRDEYMKILYETTSGG